MTWKLVDAERAVWSRAKAAPSESSTHIRAKTRLAGWLGKMALPDDPCRVVLEYPFSANGGGLRDWREEGFERKPTLAQLRRHGVPVFCICDIVLIQKGRVTTAIEVVHGHHTPPWKEQWLHEQGVGLYEAYASTILAVKGTPVSFDDILNEVSP